MKRLKTIVALMLALSCINAVCASTTVEEVLAGLKSRVAPDKRTAIWDVNAIDQDDVLTIYGTVGTQAQKDIVSSELTNSGFSGFRNNLIVLESAMPQNRRWAMVKLSIATLRTAGSHDAEMATQAIMGTPVKVLQQAGDWYRVQTPDDYIAYIPGSSMAFKTAGEMKSWRTARRFIVTVYDSRLVTQPKGDETVTDLVLGNILEYRGKRGKWLLLATPDGRQGYVEKENVEELDKWAKQNFDAALIEKTARRMMGSSYLWGGTSTKVTDCSGLTKVSYFSNGIILQRDASQQALTGMKIAGSDWQQCRQGDLLFFGNENTRRVTHVGIYLRDGQYIHCSGQVKLNSLKADDPSFLYSPLSCSRIAGQEGTKGISFVRSHPWYFEF